tara:strand:+ start:12368 stop:12682 length:315 start_codon:yes stop_codon:yes gene_type:complete
MDKHIELVKKWLDDKDSVTVNELRENAVDANAAYHAAAEAFDYHAAYYVASEAADAAYVASAYVYDVATADDAAAEAYAYHAAEAEAGFAAYWVEKYEKLTEGE